MVSLYNRAQFILKEHPRLGRVQRDLKESMPLV